MHSLCNWLKTEMYEIQQQLLITSDKTQEAALLLAL